MNFETIKQTIIVTISILLIAIFHTLYYYHVELPREKRDINAIYCNQYIEQCFNNFFVENNLCELYIEEKKTEIRIKENSDLDKLNFNKDKLLFIYNYFIKSDYENVADIITAQSALETGWWRDDFHNKRNNHWSRKMVPNGVSCIAGEKNCLLTHKDILDSCIAMEKYLKRKGYGNNKDQYLKDIVSKRFAEDPNYIPLIKKIAEKINKSIEII